MPMWVYKCNKCGSGEAVEREKPPTFCQNCGQTLANIFEAHACKENKPPTEKKAPPQEPKESEEPEEPEPAEKAPPKKKSCKYGSVPPTKEKCHNCPELDCTDRVARCKHHWKRKKLVRIVKSLLGKEVSEIISDRELWKDVARSRAAKLLDAMGIEGRDKTEMLSDLVKGIEGAHEKLKKKLK